MRIIYDERRLTNPFFLLTGLAWGGMLAVSGADFMAGALSPSPEHRVAPEASAEVWTAGWEAAGQLGGVFLLLGLLLRVAGTRIASDEYGIKKLRSWGDDLFLLRWADIRSWRVESYEEASYDTDGQGGMATQTRLVVKLGSTEEPLVLGQAWHTAIVAELETVVPMLRHEDVARTRNDSHTSSIRGQSRLL